MSRKSKIELPTKSNKYGKYEYKLKSVPPPWESNQAVQQNPSFLVSWKQNMMWCVLFLLQTLALQYFRDAEYHETTQSWRFVTLRFVNSAPFCPQGSQTRQDIMGSSVKAPVEREWTSSSLLAWTGDDELFWHILRPSWKSMQTKYTCAWHSIEKGVLYQSALSAMLRLLLAAMESKLRLLLLSSHQTKLKLL